MVNSRMLLLAAMAIVLVVASPAGSATADQTTASPIIDDLHPMTPAPELGNVTTPAGQTISATPSTEGCSDGD